MTIHLKESTLQVFVKITEIQIIFKHVLLCFVKESIVLKHVLFHYN